MLRATAETFLTSGECAWIFRSQSDAAWVDRFLTVWTAKEAFAKAVGVGLDDALQSALVLVSEDDAVRIVSSLAPGRRWRCTTMQPLPHCRLTIVY